MKEDLGRLSSEHEGLRVQYQRVSERNQEITTELHNLRAIVKDKEGAFKEMEELDKFNETLLQEMKHMRNDVITFTIIYFLTMNLKLRKKEDELLVTKKQFKQELHMSQKKLKDVSNRLNQNEPEQIVIIHYLYLMN